MHGQQNIKICDWNCCSIPRQGQASFFVSSKVSIGFSAHPAFSSVGAESTCSGVQRSALEADHYPSIAEVENEWIFISSPPYVFLAFTGASALLVCRIG